MHSVPDSDGNWLVDQSPKIFLVGAEYSVVSALVQWKNPVKLLSALPEYLIRNRLESQLKSLYSRTAD